MFYKNCGFKLCRKNFFCSKWNAIFNAVRINFGSKFGAWVSFHAAIMQSLKFQENLVRTAGVLALSGFGVFLFTGAFCWKTQPNCNPH